MPKQLGTIAWVAGIAVFTVVLVIAGVLVFSYSSHGVGNGMNSNSRPPSTPASTPSNAATPGNQNGNGNVAVAASPTPKGQSIDEIRDSLQIGSVVFNKPPEMVLDESKEIQLLVSPTTAIDELKKQVTAPGVVQGNEVPVSEYMEATLYGDNFTIANATQRKLVSRRGTTEWNWDVTPTKVGKQKLHLVLNAIIQYKEGEKPLEIKSFHEFIVVNVTFSQRIYLVASTLGTNLQWIAPSLLVPFGIWAWNRWNKKSKAKLPRKPRSKVGPKENAEKMDKLPEADHETEFDVGKGPGST